MTHMYGKEVSDDISAAQEAQRAHDVNTFKQDRRWMYGVDLMPKRMYAAGLFWDVIEEGEFQISFPPPITGIGWHDNDSNHEYYTYP